MFISSKWIEGLGPDNSVDHAARRSLEQRLSAVAHLMPMAAHLAEHDIEHVHRLRVATRRATAALKLYWDCLTPESRRWMKKWLRKIRRAAGDARDLDVLADRLAGDYGEAVAPVIDLIAKDRAAVQPAVLNVAEKCRQDDRFVRKTAKLLHGIEAPTPQNDLDGVLLFRDWAPKHFAKVVDKCTAAMPGKTSDTIALHNFRIRSKALRYAIELASPAFGPNLREDLYPTIEKLQERLGKVQDHVAAIARCQQWAAASHSEILRETLRELADAEQRGLTDSIQSFHEWWNEDRVSRVGSLLKSQVDVTERPPLSHQT